MINHPRLRHPRHYHPCCHYPHQNHGDLVDGNVGKPGTKVFIGSSAADVQQLLPGDHSFQLLNAHHHHDDHDDFDEGHGDSGNAVECLFKERGSSSESTLS